MEQQYMFSVLCNTVPADTQATLGARTAAGMTLILQRSCVNEATMKNVGKFITCIHFELQLELIQKSVQYRVIYTPSGRWIILYHH